MGGLTPGVYHAVGVAEDGRIGALRDVEIVAGRNQGPFDLPVAEAGTVRVFYEGSTEYASYSIH
ncbi:MAG: hypothetical protein GY711_10885 [bacterium]|nr:hypothetical protein [bacterium]